MNNNITSLITYLSILILTQPASTLSTFSTNEARVVRVFPLRKQQKQMMPNTYLLLSDVSSSISVFITDSLPSHQYSDIALAQALDDATEVKCDNASVIKECFRTEQAKD